MKKNVLLTGAGGAASIGVARSLQTQPINLFGVDVNPYKIFRSRCWSGNKVIPVLNGKKYIKYLNKIIGEWKIDFVHAQPFNEVYALSKYRNELDAKTFLPSHKTVSVCTNKYQSYCVWKRRGVQVPETKIIYSIDDVIEMQKLYGKVWVRAPVGAGGLGSIVAEPNNMDLVSALIRYNKGFGKYLVSEYLSPKSVTFLSVWRNGEVFGAQCRERIYWEHGSKTLSGVSGVTGAGVTVSRSDVIQVGFNAIKSVDDCPNGIFSVDMTYDQDGFPCPTEINIGKFFTTVDFFTKAGINFPALYLKLGLGESPEKIGINPLPNGLVWIRGMDCEPVLKSMKDIFIELSSVKKIGCY